MRQSIALPALAALAAMLVSLPLLAADAQQWPWKLKTPVDPALGVLDEVVEVTAAVDKSNPPVITIAVKAKAPSPGYSEFALTPKMGDPNDRIFAFEARGRAPQVLTPVITEVSFDTSYQDAPIGKFDVIEVYSKSNCVGYSVKDNAPVACTGKPGVE